MQSSPRSGPLSATRPTIALFLVQKGFVIEPELSFDGFGCRAVVTGQHEALTPSVCRSFRAARVDAWIGYAIANSPANLPSIAMLMMVANARLS